MDEEDSQRTVIIIGAGPAGLATAACLSRLSIPFIVLERETCIASLWRLHSYDRLSLHLANRFCELPHFRLPVASPTYIPKDVFIRYLDEYASKFSVRARCEETVESATYDEAGGRWVVRARKPLNGEAREYVGGFVVVATGENGEPHVPDIDGLEGFGGEVMHSSEYKNGRKYRGKSVLVVGSGNSGMEIAFDLSNYGAKASISVRSKFHIVSKEMIHLAMILLAYKMPLKLVDTITILHSKLKYGNLSKFGITRPKKGPFFLKATTGRSPVIDVGTIKKIKIGEIQVLSNISFIEGNWVRLSNGISNYFDAIIFSTGYKSEANKWLKDETHFLNKNGLPTQSYPNHWKGENGIYSAGFSRRGIEGMSKDAMLIANDIYNTSREKCLNSPNKT